MSKYSLERIESIKVGIATKLYHLQKMLADRKPEVELIDNYQEITLALSTFNTSFEAYLTNIEPLTKTQRTDVLTSISNILRSVADIANALNATAIALSLPVPYPKSSRILYTSQCILKTYGSPELRNLINIYNKFQLSTDGFTNKQKMKINIKSIDWSRISAIVIGIIALSYAIYNYEAGKVNNGIAWYNYRLFLPTGLAFIIYSFFPSSTSFTMKLGGATATGLIAFIIFFYAINPADVPNFPKN
ncbi:TPA: hypothetical protein SMN64_002096 [Proteus mirabilis]|nr:hypothetical protein [Proteus mirabilis]